MHLRNDRVRGQTNDSEAETAAQSIARCRVAPVARPRVSELLAIWRPGVRPDGPGVALGSVAKWLRPRLLRYCAPRCTVGARRPGAVQLGNRVMALHRAEWPRWRERRGRSSRLYRLSRHGDKAIPSTRGPLCGTIKFSRYLHKKSVCFDRRAYSETSYRVCGAHPARTECTCYVTADCVSDGF